VDRDGHGQLAGEGDLFGEDGELGFFWRVHVVVVETAFAECDDPFVVEPLADFDSVRLVEFRGFMRVNADRRKDAPITFRQSDRIGIPTNSVARPDRNQRLDATLEGAIEGVLSVLVEAVGRDMTMAVDPHLLRGPHPATTSRSPSRSRSATICGLALRWIRSRRSC